MAAKRYTVKLFKRGWKKHQQDANLDPTSPAALRATLEQLVEAHHGSLKVDLSEWSIEVQTLGGGMIHGRCSVAKNGLTVTGKR